MPLFRGMHKKDLRTHAMEKKRTRETESAGVGPKGARGLIAFNDAGLWVLVH